jgi:uncharacterized protein
MQVSLALARRLALRAQGLEGNWPLPPGKEGVAQAIERLGYVQIDTVSVVQRAHHHVLWCRCPDYTLGALDELQGTDRRIFEDFNRYSAVAYMPIGDYRYHLPRFRAQRERPDVQQWLSDDPLPQAVLERIREEGPLTSTDFEAPPGWKRGTWWSRKPAKQALERLTWTGHLMVRGRRGFQRLYDLPERVVPAGLDVSEPGECEMGQYLARQALTTCGIAGGDAFGQQWARAWRRAATAALQEMLSTGEAVEVQVEGVTGKPLYVLAAKLEDAAQALAGEADGRRAFHILSPFDGLPYSRQRLQDLFGFDFRLECYTPAAQRKYGYFCLPLLWGDEFVGRLDAKAERKDGTLVVRGLFLEPGYEQEQPFLPAFAERLQQFSAFNGCERVRVETADAQVGARHRMGLALIGD